MQIIRNDNGQETAMTFRQFEDFLATVSKPFDARMTAFTVSRGGIAYTKHGSFRKVEGR